MEFSDGAAGVKNYFQKLSGRKALEVRYERSKLPPNYKASLGVVRNLPGLALSEISPAEISPTSRCYTIIKLRH